MRSQRNLKSVSSPVSGMQIKKEGRNLLIFEDKPTNKENV